MDRLAAGLPAEDLRELIAARRLRLGGLDTTTRRLVLANLSGLAAMGLLLAARAVQVEFPGGQYSVAAVAEQVPRALVLLAYPALAFAAAAIAAGARDQPNRRGRLMMVTVGLLGALIAVTTARSHGLLDLYRQIIVGRELVPSWLLDGVIAMAWATLAGAVVVAFAPRLWAQRMGALYPALAAGPFMAALAVYLVAWLETIRGPDVSALGGTLTPEGGIATGLFGLVATVGFWATAAFLWQAALGARGARDVGERIALRLGTRNGWIAAIIVGKLVWLSLGLAGLLPTLLGGNSERWTKAREDGLFAWLYAAALAGAAALWLTRRRQPLNTRGELAATAAICAGFVVALLLAALAALGAGTLNGLFPGSAAAALLVSVNDWAGDRLILTQVLCVVLAAVAAVVLHLTNGPPGAKALLLVFALWAMPRTVSVAWEELAGRQVNFGRIELVTLDMTLTVAAVGLIALAARQHARFNSAVLLAAVVVAGVISHTGWVLSALLTERSTFYLALLFAPAYQFILASSALNKAGPDRRSRVLLATGSALAIMTLVSVQEATGFAGAGVTGIESFGVLLIAMPLAAVLVAGGASAAASRPPPTGARTDSEARSASTAS